MIFNFCKHHLIFPFHLEFPCKMHFRMEAQSLLFSRDFSHFSKTSQSSPDSLVEVYKLLAASRMLENPLKASLASSWNRDTFEVNIPTTSPARRGERGKKCCVCGNSTEFYHRMQTDGNLFRKNTESLDVELSLNLSFIKGRSNFLSSLRLFRTQICVESLILKRAISDWNLSQNLS